MNSQCLKCTFGCCYTADPLHMKCFSWVQGAGGQSRILFQGHPRNYTGYSDSCFRRELADMLHLISTGDKYPIHKRKSTHSCVTLLCLPGLWCMCGSWVELCRKPEEAACSVQVGSSFLWLQAVAVTACARGHLNGSHGREDRQVDTKNINTFSRQHQLC